MLLSVLSANPLPSLVLLPPVLLLSLVVQGDGSSVICIASTARCKSLSWDCLSPSAGALAAGVSPKLLLLKVLASLSVSDEVLSPPYVRIPPASLPPLLALDPFVAPVVVVLRVARVDESLSAPPLSLAAVGEALMVC
jgi:hypothetical protein